MTQPDETTTTEAAEVEPEAAEEAAEETETAEAGNEAPAEE